MLWRRRFTPSSSVPTSASCYSVSVRLLGNKIGKLNTLKFGASFEIAESYAVNAQAYLVETGFARYRGKTKKWIVNFLSNRSQQVVIEGKHSYTVSVA